eukprot:m.233049 g.233049  ORF g.233049 m.233049 type:complete len:59 (+) comp15241_c0_seq2:1510-1686(+)
MAIGDECVIVSPESMPCGVDAGYKPQELAHCFWQPHASSEPTAFGAITGNFRETGNTL